MRIILLALGYIAMSLLSSHASQASAKRAFVGTLNLVASSITDTSFYNLNGLSAFRNSLTTVSSNIVDVVVIGDSITQGFYSDVDVYTNGYAGRLTRALNEFYGSAGTGIIPAWRTLYLGFTNHVLWYFPTNANGTINGIWSYESAPPEYGGPFNRCIKTTGNSGGRNVSLQGETCIYFDILYEEYANSSSGTNTLHVDVDGSTVTNFTIGSSSSPSFKPFRVNSGTTNGTITLYPASSGTLLLLGFKLYTENHGIIVSQYGWSGQGITNMMGSFAGSTRNYDTNANQTTNMTMFFNCIQPKLTILAMSVNDYRFQTLLSVYSNEVDLVSGLATNYGSLLLLGCGQRDPGSFSPNPSTQPQYHTVLSNAAVRYNASWYNIMTRWGDYTNANTVLGYMYDTVHPNNAGHTDMGNALSNALLRINN